MSSRKLLLSNKEAQTSNNWFEISNQGWRRMNAGRSMAFLVREGISNIMDLTDVKNATITIEPNHVIVEDDSETGFSTPELITTVILTNKEETINKRGLKARGLKELISAGDKAVVETVGETVSFNKHGTRTTQTNDRQKGTRVEIWSSLDTWNEIDESITYLSLIIPPATVNLTINGKTIVRPNTIAKVEHICIETVVIVDGIQKSQYEWTDILIHEHEKDQESWIYEMGVPIQKTLCPWHLDVQQRVPMNDNRDTVNDWYVKRLHSYVLSRMLDGLTGKDIQDEWVLNCISHCEDYVQAKIVDRITGGKKSVVKTSNTKANDVAKQHGYEVIDTKHIAAGLANIISAKLPSSESVAKTIAASAIVTEVEPTEDLKKFAEVHKFLAEKVVDHDVDVTFFSQGEDCTGMTTEAKYQRATPSSHLKYNVMGIIKFNKPLSSYALAVLAHELAHEYGDDGHGPMYLEHLPIVCGKLCMIIFDNHDKIPHVSEQKILPTKSEFITCIDCGVKREVKTQDVHQTVRCKDCQKKHRALKRSQKE